MKTITMSATGQNQTFPLQIGHAQLACISIAGTLAGHLQDPETGHCFFISQTGHAS